MFWLELDYTNAYQVKKKNHERIHKELVIYYVLIYLLPFHKLTTELYLFT